MGNVVSAKIGNFVLRLFFCKAVEPIAIDLPSSSLGPARSFVLLVPGAFLRPSDYVALRRALVESNCAVVTCSPVWKHVDVTAFMNTASKVVDKAINLGLAEAERALPKHLLEKKGFGPVTRYTRLIVCVHSLSGVVGCSVPLRKAAGVVLLASSLSRSVGVSAAIREFPSHVPLLSIFGDYDGQHHLAKVAVDLSNSGLLFCRESEGDAIASTRAFALVERCNHASFSNQVRNAKRGDLSLEGVEGVDQATSMARVAILIGLFAEAHGLDVTEETQGDAQDARRLQAVRLLVAETTHARSLLVPFLYALGRVPQSEPLGIVESVWKYAYGAEIVPGNAPEGGFVPRHPGELAAAEAFAIRAQEYILQEYSIGGTRSIPTSSTVVTASVHTVAENFLRSKVVTRVAAGTLHIDVQCFLFAAKSTIYSHVSPMYMLKLKSLEGLGLSVGGEGNTCVESPSPADLFRQIAWRDAEEICPERLLSRYRERGRSLQIKERYHCVPPLWARSDSTLDVKAGVLVLNGFDMAKACGDQREEGDPSPISIAGVLYYQVPSTAWCLEHIMVHGLK